MHAPRYQGTNLLEFFSEQVWMHHSHIEHLLPEFVWGKGELACLQQPLVVCMGVEHLTPKTSHRSAAASSRQSGVCEMCVQWCVHCVHM